MYIDKQKLLDSYKNNYSETARFFPDDDDLYNHIYKSYNPEELTGIPGAQFRTPQYYIDEKKEQRAKAYNLINAESQDKKEVVTPEPDSWNFNLAGQVGEIFDLDYLKYAATLGSSDVARVAITGKSGYVLKNDKGEVISPEEYAKDLNMLEQTGAWILGQGNPVDASLWLFTGGAGKLFWSGGTKAAGALAKTKWGQYLAKNMSNRLSKKGNVYSKYFSEYFKGAGKSVVESGGAVTTFMGATGALQSAARQRKSKIDSATGHYIGDISANEVIYDAAESAVTGAIIGAGAGLTTFGVTKGIGRLSNQLKNSNSKYAQKVADIIKNNEQIVATGVSIPIEGAILGNTQYLIDGVPKKEDGTVDWPQIRKDYYHGVITDVGIRTSLNLVSRLNNYIKPMHKVEVNQSASKVDDFENQKTLIEDTRRSLNDILKPAEVDEFIKNLTETEKIKAQAGKLTDPEFELIDSFNKKYPDIKKIQDKLEKTNYDFDKLSGDEQDLVYAAHASLPVYSEILSERLSKNSNFTYLKYVADEYNTSLKLKDEPKWKDISKEEKDKFIRGGQQQIRTLLKDVDNYITTINENVLEPKSMKAKQISQLSSDVEKLYKELKGPKKTKAKQVVKDIGKIKELDEADLSSIKIKLEDIKAELPVKKQISILKDELLTNMPSAYAQSPQRWQSLVRSKKSVDSLKQLRDIAMKQKKQEADPTNIEYKSNIKDYARKDFVLNIPTKGGKTQQKIKETGKTIDELVNEANVSAVKKAELKLGFDKYVKISKAENKPSSYAKIVEFFEYLEKNNIKARDLEDPTMFERFISENKLVGNQKKTYQTALSKFFGGKGVQTSGFIDKYGKRGSKPITTKQDVVRKFGEKDAILLTSKGANKLLSLKYKDNRSVSGKTIQAATELFYKFGRRGEELLRETYAKNIDEKSGTVQLWSGKNKTYDSYPLKQMDPQLFNKLVALKKGKNPDDLLFTTKNNTSISNDKFNLILRDLISKNKVEINQAGKYANVSKGDAYKAFGVSDFRKIIATDSKYFDMRDFAIKLEGRTESVAAGYVQKSFVSDYKKFIKERAKLNQTELRKVPEERMTVPKDEAIGAPATAVERERFKRWASKNYPEIKTELDKSVLTGDKGEYLPDRVLEQVFGTIVKVRQKAPIIAAFHGNIHPIIKTLRAIGKSNPNKKLGKSAAGLMRELERRITKTDNFKFWYKQYITKDKMKPAEAKDRAIEEASVLELDNIVAGKAVNKSLYRKIVDWFKRAYLNFKSYFTKASKISDKDLTELLGEKIYNRNIKEIPFISFTKEKAGRIEFMTAKKSDLDVIRDIAKKELDFYAKTHKLTSNVDKENLAKRAGLDAGIIDFNINTANSSELKSFIDVFQTGKYQDVKGSQTAVKSILFEKFDVLDKIKQYKVKTNLTDKDMSDYFKSRGVKDGNIQNASLKELKDWKDLLYYRMEESPFKSYLDREISALTEKESKKLKINESLLGRIQLAASKNLLGAARFARSIGLDNVSKWHSSHMSAEQTYVGPLAGFIQRSEAVKSFKDVSPVFGLLEAKDGSGNFMRLNDKTTLAGDKNKALKFIKKAFFVEEKPNKKGRIEYFNKGLRWDPNTKEGTKEGELMYFFKNNIMKYLENQFKEITKLRFPNKGAREEFMKDNGIEFLNKTDVGFYIPMRFSKEFGEHYDPNFIIKIGNIKDVARKYAIKRAEKKYGDKFKQADDIKQKEMIDEFIELGIGIAKSKVLTEVEFGSSKTTLKNLISRNEFSYPQNIKNKDGSVVKVIENAFDGVVTPYVNGFAKQNANLEFAPWSVGLKGYGYDGDLDAMFDDAFRVFEIKGVKRRKEITNMIKQGIFERVGVTSGERGAILSGVIGGAREYSATLLRLQMGGPIPMAGIHNILYQTPNMLFAFRTRDVITNFFRAFNFENRLAAQDAGATSSIGLMSWKPKNPWAEYITDYVFKTGGQPLTENFNRTWSSLAVMEEFPRLVEDIKMFPSNHKRYKLGNNRLKDFYRLTDGEFETLKQFGLEPDLRGLSELDGIAVRRVINNAYNKAKLQGNILTAGTTVDSAMPYWANYGLSKPLLMYKRIAYNTTLNLKDILDYSRKNKHWMRIFLYIAGAYAGGKLKTDAIARWFYDQDYPNTENVNWWTEFTNTLFYGGFGGILSDFMGPYRQSFLSVAENPVTESALLDNINKLAVLLKTTAISGEKALDVKVLRKVLGEQKISFSTAMEDFLKSTAAGYRNSMKVYDKITNPYKTNSKKIRIYAKDWEGKHGKGQFLDIDDPKEDYMYFRDAKKIFESGDDAAFIDHMIPLYWANVSKFQGEGNTESQAIKKAFTVMQNTLNRLNPVPYSFQLDSGKVINDITAFLATLDPEQKKIVAETFLVYEKRIKGLPEKINFQLRKKNMHDIIRKFDYQLDPKYVRALKELNKSK